MSKTTELLEAAVAEVIANRPDEGQRPSARQRAAVDRAFASVMKIIAPRVRHFIRQYGLTHYWEDAEQVCAIGVHRAIEAYDPAKAMFTTFVNWQLRGELQGLRFRLMDDQRPSAKKVSAITVSLHGRETGPQGEEMSLAALIEDEAAMERTEASAADHLAEQMSRTLLNQYVLHLRRIGIMQIRRKARAARSGGRRNGGAGLSSVQGYSRGEGIDPEDLRKLEERIRRDRDIVSRHLFGSPEEAGTEAEQGLTRERIRQITRRAAKLIGELIASEPRFSTALNMDERDGPEESRPRGGLLPAGRNRTAVPDEIRVTEPDPLPAGENGFPAPPARAGISSRP